MKSLGCLSFILLVFTLTSCSYTLGELGLYGDGKVPKISLAQMSEMDLNFATVKVLALSTCFECHASGNHALNTPEKILELKAEVLDSVRKKTMPPAISGYKPLNDCEIKILETWIEDRTQNRATVQKVKDLPVCANAKPTAPKPITDFAALPLSYENLKREILAPKCLSCHYTGAPGYQYPLDSLEILIEKEMVLATSEESSLYQLVLPERVQSFMPPRRSGLQPLTAAEIDYVKRWIDDGAKP